MHGDRFCRLWVAVLLLTLCLSASAVAQHYTRTDLTANSAAVSTGVIVDPNLVNAWGLSRASGSPWWISDNGMGLSTLYDLTGAPQPLVVTTGQRTDGTLRSNRHRFQFHQEFRNRSGSARRISVRHRGRNHCRMESGCEPNFGRYEERSFRGRVL